MHVEKKFTIVQEELKRWSVRLDSLLSETINRLLHYVNRGIKAATVELGVRDKNQNYVFFFPSYFFIIFSTIFT